METGQYANYDFDMNEAIIVLNPEKVYGHFGAGRNCMFANCIGIVVTARILFQHFATQAIVRHSESDRYGKVVYDSRFKNIIYTGYGPPLRREISTASGTLDIEIDQRVKSVMCPKCNRPVAKRTNSMYTLLACLFNEVGKRYERERHNNISYILSYWQHHSTRRRQCCN